MATVAYNKKKTFLSLLYFYNYQFLKVSFQILFSFDNQFSKKKKKEGDFFIAKSRYEGHLSQ